MSIENLERQVINWATERDIFRLSTPDTRLDKFIEESEELEQAVLVGEMYDIRLEAGDVIVTLINLLNPMGLSLEECLQAAYNKIKVRTGKMIDGKFVKDEVIK